MSNRASPLITIALAVGLSTAFGTTEGPHWAPRQPWAGWWWPQYCNGDTSCHRNHRHLWLGSLDSGDYDGPIFDLDTRYFWRPEPKRDSAQDWEYTHHRTTDSSGGTSNDGHCNGLAAASILEDEPPDDCGALSQSDLKGLLTELYYATSVASVLSPRRPNPARLWKACRSALWSDMAGPESFMLDFLRDGSDTSDLNTPNQVNWFAVYGYKVDYWAGSQPGLVDGTLSLYYEERYDCPGLTGNRPDSVKHSFTGVLMTDSLSGGSWSNPAAAPDQAVLPRSRVQGDTHVNPCLNYDTIKRVIDHKTIILDDAYMDSVDIYHYCSYDSWVRRPGYADSCWAGYCQSGLAWHYMFWSPRLGCDGQWSLYVYKTEPPQGEGYVDSSAHFILGSWSGDINQAVPQFDTWQLVNGPSYLTAGTRTLVLDDFLREPDHFCYTYFDAFKLECTGGGGEGGASSAAVALADEFPRVRVKPNPARGTARISYVVSKPGRVDIAVYDVTGRAVLRASQGIQRAGLQNAAVSVAGLSAGTYMARVSVNDVHSTCRFVVCK